MKSSKEDNKSDIPAPVKAVLNILEKSFDIVFLINDKGNVLHRFSREDTAKYSSEIINYTKEKYSEGKTDLIYSCPPGKIKINISRTGKNDPFILGTGIYIREMKKGGLLWDTFYIKGNPSYSPVTKYITGFSDDEINSLPGKAFNLLEEDEAEKIKSAVTGFIIDSRQNKLELEYKIRTKTGKTIWLREIIFSKRNKEGKITEYECSLSESTELLNEKTEIVKDLKSLQDLNKAKDQFISVLSHDLKSPYTSILGFSEILLNETSLSQEDRNEYLSYINQSSQNQLKLIDNLLEWSRLITGRKKIEKVKLNLKTIINNVISNNTRNIHLKNLEVKITGENYIFTEADERLLDEVFNIFISNAVKYSYKGKTVEIHCSRFRDNQLEVIIKDEGSGMNENVMRRLLKIDQIVSIPGTSGERGTGISLLLANEIIKSHNGELWFYSSEGKGSEFHFTIPAASNLILLIDDDNTEKTKIFNMLKSGFTEFRYAAESNFYGALNKIQMENPAAVIMAHNLSLMNGFEFIRTLRSEEKYSVIPVIVYSPDITEDMKREYRGMGVQDLIFKPVDLKNLKFRLEENLKA